MVLDTDIMAEGKTLGYLMMNLILVEKLMEKKYWLVRAILLLMGSYNENGSDSDSREDGSESESDFVLSDHFEEDEDVIEAWKDLRSNEMKDKMVAEDEDQHKEKEKYPLDDCDSGHSFVTKATFFATNCNLKAEFYIHVVYMYIHLQIILLRGFFFSSFYLYYHMKRVLYVKTIIFI